MALEDLVTDYLTTADGSRRSVERLPAAAAVRLGALEPAAQEAARDDGPCVLVDAWFAAWDDAAPGGLAERLGPRDVAVVLLRTTPAELPVGPVVSSICGAGLRVVRAEPVSAGAAKTVLVLTRDPDLPLRTAVLGTAVPDAAAARTRLESEWLVEGLQLRAALYRSEADRAQTAEQAVALRAERDTLERALREQQARRAGGWKGRLAAGRRDASRALHILREDPRAGATRIAEAARRRWRGSGHQR